MYQTSDGFRASHTRPDGTRRFVRGKTRAEVEARLAELMDADESIPALGNDASTYGQLWDVVKAHVDADNATDPDVTEGDFYFGNLPVGMLLMSDWHVGSRWTDYQRLEDDVAYVAKYRKANPDALRLAHLGDLADNYFAAGKHPSGMHETVVARTDKQRNLALWLAKKAGDWDAMLLGCHLAWNLTQVGEDVLAPIADELNAVNGGYGMNMNIHVGNQTYLHAIRHKPFRGKGAKAVEGADVISTSHQHVCDLQVSETEGRHVVTTRSGGYKGGDCFARAGAFTRTKSADCGVPLVIYLPDEHRVIAFDGHAWKDGLAYLTMLRKQYGVKGRR